MHEHRSSREIVAFIQGWLYAIETGEPELDDQNPVIDTLRSVLAYAQPIDNYEHPEDDDQTFGITHHPDIIVTSGDAGEEERDAESEDDNIYGRLERGHIDWKPFAKKLLWHNIVYHKNEDSGYEQLEASGAIGNFSISAIYWGPYKKLTWKELALALGLFEDQLLPDGHNCHHCKREKECQAYFKYDPDQERCSDWPANKIDNEIEKDGK